MTPGGLRHQLPKHSNPSENANDLYSKQVDNPTSQKEVS